MKQTLLALLFSPVCLFAQPVGVTEVVSWQFGSNTTFGQAAGFFPANVLNGPTDSASVQIPAAGEHQVVSLGQGGWIVLGFGTRQLVDQPGPDFVIYENVFWPFGDSTRAWKEPGVVSVSSNGVDFTAFPSDSVTLAGCAGLTPTRGSELGSGWPAGGGDAFDLATIGLESARYIRIDDRSRWVRGASGFDLDGVMLLNHSLVSVKPETVQPAAFTLAIYPNPANPQTTINWTYAGPDPVQWTLVSLTGQVLKSWQSSAGPVSTSWQLDLSPYSSGVYLLTATGSRFKLSRPVVLIQ